MATHSLEIETIDQDNHMVHSALLISLTKIRSYYLLSYKMMAYKSMIKKGTWQELEFNLES